MLFHTLIDILEAEYQHRTGILPDQPWRRWLWQPWVREFLRTYKAPRLALVRRVKS